MNHTVYEQFHADLNGYLKSRYLYKRNHAFLGLGGNVSARTKKFDLYIRMKAADMRWPKSTLIIARLAFFETRGGNGTDFIRFLKEWCVPYGYEHIGIERTNSDSAAFATRLGFISCGDKNYVSGCSTLNL